VRAARWLHGLNSWIGAGWCRGDGSWEILDGDVAPARPNCLHAVSLQKPHISTLGQGILKRSHIPHVGNLGRGIHKSALRDEPDMTHQEQILDWFLALQTRLLPVRIACGDWTRVVTPACTTGLGVTGIFFDPPYSADEDRDMGLYPHEDGAVAHEVRQWCLTHGDDPKLRLLMCGYGDVHDALLQHGWSKYHWTGHPGMGNTGDGRGERNRHREAVYASPHCIPRAQLSLL